MRSVFFFVYGDIEFGYCFWDDQNWKIIKNRNAIFNEQEMYKGKLSIKSKGECLDFFFLNGLVARFSNE